MQIVLVIAGIYRRLHASARPLVAARFGLLKSMLKCFDALYHAARSISFPPADGLRSQLPIKARSIIELLVKY
jgi:hypothetical protein